ncbi:substrate-binding periplasmic protein [Paeniglutamicibacter cryotolerans]|uniref:ABC-type amino acid transport substrate-binding protein n=1 Tax=Paeniglutamicibacter cryotolerans TaxID=670079 RepID=A0A839QRX0_9MICC|nr:transporter substrate-binding domain-containing protein [Paeniglutamicibacter cryotolerans]MBB2997524.1 ABC-type amino acid transport substrate-binding protein [Paeniglutamicibacter cryotolerans]
MIHAIRNPRNSKLGRAIAAGLVGGGLVFGMVACSSAEPDRAGTSSDCTARWTFPTVKKGVISVATVNNPPMVALDPNAGKAEGLEADILEGFAADACLPLEFNRMTGAAAVAAMSGGKMDIGAGGWGITEARGQMIGQLDEPTVYNPPAILSNQGVSTIAQMEGVKIGVEGGSLYQEKLESRFGKDRVTSYQTIDAAVQDMKNGRVQATFGDSTQMAQAATANGLNLEADLHLQSEDTNYSELTTATLVNLPFTKTNSELGKALNEYVTELRESGELTTILVNWGLTEGNATGKF